MIIVPFIDPSLYKFYFPSNKAKNLSKDGSPDLSLKSSLRSRVYSKYKKTHLMCRDTSLPPFCVGKIWQVYNGKTFRMLQISEAMVGHKAGEFIPTRSFYHYKKKKKKWGKKTP